MTLDHRSRQESPGGSRWSTVRTSTVRHRNCSVPGMSSRNIFGKTGTEIQSGAVALAPAVYGGVHQCPAPLPRPTGSAGARDLGDARRRFADGPRARVVRQWIRFGCARHLLARWQRGRVAARVGRSGTWLGTTPAESDRSVDAVGDGECSVLTRRRDRRER